MRLTPSEIIEPYGLFRRQRPEAFLWNGKDYRIRTAYNHYLTDCSNSSNYFTSESTATPTLLPKPTLLNFSSSAPASTLASFSRSELNIVHLTNSYQKVPPVCDSIIDSISPFEIFDIH